MAGLKRLLKPQALAVAFAAAGLVACNDASSGMAADGAVCQPFPKTSAQTGTGTSAATPPPPVVAGDPAAALDDCLHRWGYALAHSSDDAPPVANAVLAACGPSLSRWNQAALVSTPAAAPAPSLITGQPTTPLSEHFVFAQSRALFYVVQARAGKCAAPPMKDGVPTGIAN
ncbi:hypothetical protein [Phenylobacterium sp.]|jgi:hypothetical protein|uniref:hypothetical protein n=1 Tax=Phenylobacterium sp. TaxID=1871053 RepID=UPI002F42CD09